MTVQLLFLLGSVSNQQQFSGQIVGFQIFSTYLPLSVIQLTGCGGIRADLFDSNLDSFVITSNEIIQRDVEIDSCKVDSSKDNSKAQVIDQLF